MSLENILFNNSNNLFCKSLTCNVLNISGSMNVSGGINYDSNVSISGNLDVSGNILSGGYIYAGNNQFSASAVTTASASSLTIPAPFLPDSINYATGNNLGNVTFTMPNADSIISGNSLSNLPNGSTFTFLLGNLATGTSYLTLASSSSGNTVVKPTIYMPINPSGTTFRNCMAIINKVSSPAQIDIY